MAMTTDVETYFIDGCGRCALGGTPDCKVHTWEEELKLLRNILLQSGLTEESKWGVPCYSYKGNNVLLMSAFKNFCSLNFLKGALLQDAEKLLVKAGENTQAARLLKFTSVQEIIPIENTIKAYIQEAIDIEEKGLIVTLKKIDDYPVPEEFQSVMDENPKIRAAFDALTPGRRKGYLLHFTQPVQSKTRTARIEKCLPKIMQGKGFHDR